MPNPNGYNPPILVIAAGHGTRPDNTFDPGAINPIDKTQEHDINIKVRDYCIAELNKYNCVTIKDENLAGSAHDPNWSALLASYRKRNFKPDLLIEIHHDASNAKAAGFGILPKTVFKGRITNLCNDITKQYSLLGLPTKASYSDVRGLGLLKVLSYPTAIWECNITKAVSEKELHWRGVGIALGIVTWLAIPVGQLANSTQTQDTIYKVRTFLGLQGAGGQDKEFISAVIAWKRLHKYYPSAVITDYILKKMGIK